MAILLGRAINNFIETRELLSITYPSPNEYVRGSPTTIPSSEPGSPQYTWTVVAGDFPTMDGNYFEGTSSPYYVGHLVLSGQNTDSSARTLYYKVGFNGSYGGAAGVGITAGYYWTLNITHKQTAPIAIGDTLSVKLYCTAGTYFNWDYTATYIVPSRVRPVDDDAGTVLYDVSLTDIIAYPTLSAVGLNPVVAGVSPSSFMESQSNINPGGTGPIQLTAGATLSYDYIYMPREYAAYTFFQVYYGEDWTATQSTNSNHATGHPRYYQDTVPQTLKWRRSNA